MEVQIDIECPYREDVIKIPTPMELQVDLGGSQGSYLASKFPPPWNFKLTWTVNEDKIESKFRPHGTSN